MGIEHRGFASMTKQRRCEIAGKGGKAAHEAGTGHEWDRAEARDAGRKSADLKKKRRASIARQARLSTAGNPPAPPDVNRMNDDELARHLGIGKNADDAVEKVNRHQIGDSAPED